MLDTTAKPSTQLATTKITTTLKITNAKNSEEPTRKTEVEILTSTRQNLVTGKAGHQHDAVDEQLKSPKINYVIMGCLLGLAAMVVCLVIAFLIVRKHR